MIQITVVILDWSLDSQGKKEKKYSECVGMGAQVKNESSAASERGAETFYQTIFISSRFSFHSLQNY